jgi:hypothetical protein
MLPRLVWNSCAQVFSCLSFLSSYDYSQVLPYLVGMAGPSGQILGVLGGGLVVLVVVVLGFELRALCLSLPLEPHPQPGPIY